MPDDKKVPLGFDASCIPEILVELQKPLKPSRVEQLLEASNARVRKLEARIAARDANLTEETIRRQVGARDGHALVKVHSRYTVRKSRRQA